MWDYEKYERIIRLYSMTSVPLSCGPLSIFCEHGYNALSHYQLSPNHYELDEMNTPTMIL